MENENETQKKCLVVGIGGISRAGKSTLIKALKDRLSPEAVFHIDDYLINFYKENLSLKETPDFLKTKKGRLSKSKVTAYLYQQSETDLMNEVRVFVATKTDRKVVANIHDAIVLNKSLIADDYLSLIDHIQVKFHNPYLKMSKKALEAYGQ